MTMVLPPLLTECSCGPVFGQQRFYCNRHRCSKTNLSWLQCRTRRDYFDQWDNAAAGLISGATTISLVCIHRGAEHLRHVKCELCGSRHTLRPVFSCVLHGECTLGRWGTRTTEQREMHSCAGCLDQTEPAPCIETLTDRPAT